MDKPENKIFKQINSHVEKMRALELEYKSMKAELKTAVRSLQRIENKSQRNKSALYIYWMLPEVAAEDISYGLIGKNETRNS